MIQKAYITRIEFIIGMFVKHGQIHLHYDKTNECPSSQLYNYKIYSLKAINFCLKIILEELVKELFAHIFEIVTIILVYVLRTYMIPQLINFVYLLIIIYILRYIYVYRFTRVTMQKPPCNTKPIKINRLKIE